MSTQGMGSFQRIEWQVNPLVRMVGEQVDHAIKFSLYKGPTVISFDTLPISEFGVCVQEWVRADQERQLQVRMFSVRGREETYVVVIDVAAEQFKLFKEKNRLDEKTFLKRTHQMDPDVRSATFLGFTTAPLASWIGWNETNGKVKSQWKKSNEKSEVGITRQNDVLGITETGKVVFAAHVNCRRNANASTLWERAQVVQTTVNGVNGFSGEIVQLTTQQRFPANIPDEQTYEEQVQFYNDIANRPVVYATSTITPNTQQRSLVFYEPEEAMMYLEFMPDTDFATTTVDTIETYIKTECLNSATTLGSTPFSVTIESHRFRDGLTLPTLRLTMTRGSFIKFLGWFNAWLPSLTASGIAQDEASRTRIKENLILNNLLKHPNPGQQNLTPEQIQTATLAEIEKAYTTNADINIWINFTRTHAEIDVDQTPYSGTKYRLGIDARQVEAAAPVPTPAPGAAVPAAGNTNV